MGCICKTILKDNSMLINFKLKVGNTCSLPVATDHVETMPLTNKGANILSTTQRAMRRIMLGISLRHEIRNNAIKSKPE